MNHQQTAKQIRNLIAKGQLEKAANALVSYFDKEMKEEDKAKVQLYNQVINQLSQLSDLKKEELSGVISQVDAGLKRNKIRMALLEITDGLEEWEEGKTVKPISASPPSVLDNDKKRWKVVAGFMGLILIGFLIWWMIPNGADTTIPKGCYVKTSISTPLLMEPEWDAGRLGSLQKNKYYEVHEVVVEDFAGRNNKYYKVRDNKLGVGFVKHGPLVDEVSDACGRIKVTEKNPPPSGCYITTATLTSLRSQANLFATGSRLPSNKHYQVIETKFVQELDTKYRFFKIQDPQLGIGWVTEKDHLDFISPKCPTKDTTPLPQD